MFRAINSKLSQSNLNQTVRILLKSKQDVIEEQINKQSVRYARNIKPWKNGPIDLWKQKIYSYEYRRGRAKKVLKVNLPDFEKSRIKNDFNLSTEQLRSHLKERGLVPNRKWLEKPIYIGDSGTILDPYVPPEGDGKSSIISKKGAVQKVDAVTVKTKQVNAVRRIKKYLDTFDPYQWALNESLGIYIKAHEALAEGNEEALHTVVTDTCLPKMLYNAECKTIKWQYVKSIELPRIVNIKVQDKNGIAFAQITVRFYSQQILAIYDKFGRLVSGSEAVLKDVLDYIVFENRISSIHGIWRIHGKINPEWNVQNELSAETVIKNVEERIEE